MKTIHCPVYDMEATRKQCVACRHYEDCEFKVGGSLFWIFLGVILGVAFAIVVLIMIWRSLI